MKPEQINELVNLEEQLVDLFKHECTPGKWRAAKTEAEKQQGYRDKKVALATMQLVGRIQNALRETRGDGGGAEKPNKQTATEPADEMATDVKRLRKRAASVLKKHGFDIH
jgi:hypothetical protein